MHTLHCRCLGEPAAVFLQECERGTVFAVFERSLYIQTEPERLVCVGEDTLSPGPLMALCSGWFPASALPCAHSSVWREGRTLRFEGTGIILRTDAAALWSPPPISPYDPARLCTALAAMMRLDAGLCPKDGFAPLLTLHTEENAQGHSAERAEAVLLRAARQGLDALRAWLAATTLCVRKSQALCDQAVLALLGLGPGLTPSGDDALGGALLALHLLREDERCAILGQTILQHSQATHAISRAHLRAAASGLAAEPLHEVLCRLLEGEICMEEHLRGLNRMGHSSGWDALTGALTVLNWKLADAFPHCS